MANNTDFYHYTDPLNRDTTLVRQEGKLERVVSSLFKAPHICAVDAINIAIFGDLHGHITEALIQLREWQQFSGTQVAGILQVGDIGAFDYTSNIDATSRKMIEKDQQELGFRDYFYGSAEAEAFFGKGGYFRGLPFYFVDGNHDDINFVNSMSEREDQAYENIQFLSGVREAEFSGKKLLVAGIGWHDYKPKLREVANRKVDILVTHSKTIPQKRREERRTEDVEVVDLSREVDYRFHFFGHHRYAPRMSEPHRNSYGFNDVKAKTSGGMGILELSEKQRGFFYYIPNLRAKK